VVNNSVVVAGVIVNVQVKVVVSADTWVAVEVFSVVAASPMSLS